MNKLLLSTSIFLTVFVLTIQTGSAQTIKAMTYNIKYDNTNDTVNNWNDRKEKMIELIQHYTPSFLGIQEGLYRQVSYLNTELSKYDYIGVGRDDGKKKGEFSALFYNSNDFNVLQSHTFWLSTTPDKISVGWDASMERICTYGLFQHKKTKEQFWVFNTHFDHIGDLARKNAAQLIIDKIKSINTKNLAVILMGDFNLSPEAEAIATIKTHLKDSYITSKTPPYGPKGTFNGFTNKIMTDRIDYVFVKHFSVESVIQIDDKMDNNKHISDHIPVLVTLTKE